MNTRLLGAAVLIALAVLLVPMFFSGKPPAPGDQTVNLAIPQAPDRELQTRTMSLNPDGTGNAGNATTVQPAAPAAPGASSDRLATVNIGSNRPRDVETDPQAHQAPQPTTVTTGTGASPTQPVIPMQGKSAPTSAAPAPTPPSAPAPTVAKTPAAPAPAPERTTAPAKPTAVAAAPTPAPASPAPAAQGSYRLNLSAYASAANAAALQRKVQALGYPASSHVVTQAGKQLTQVMAGPFETRTAAEAARLKIAQTVPSVQPHLAQTADDEAPARATAVAPTRTPTTSTAATAATAAPKAGGWAVQVAALGSQTDANAMRDKLRANGFDGYVSSVQVGGKQLWQVRAGPQTQRSDAQRVHDQIKAKLGIDGVVRQVP